MSNENQRQYERKLDEGKTLTPPKDINDRRDQDNAKAAHKNKS